MKSADTDRRYANLFTISGYPQWYPFGIAGSNYQEADETTLFRFSIEET